MSKQIEGLVKYSLYKQAQHFIPQPFFPSFITPHLAYFPYHPFFMPMTPVPPAQYAYPAPPSPQQSSQQQEKKEGLGSKILGFAKEFIKFALPTATIVKQILPMISQKKPDKMKETSSTTS
jgi:hypothetical protein